MGDGKNGSASQAGGLLHVNPTGLQVIGYQDTKGTPVVTTQLDGSWSVRFFWVSSGLWKAGAVPWHCASSVCRFRPFCGCRPCPIELQWFEDALAKTQGKRPRNSDQKMSEPQRERNVLRDQQEQIYSCMLTTPRSSKLAAIPMRVLSITSKDRKLNIAPAFKAWTSWSAREYKAAACQASA